MSLRGLIGRTGGKSKLRDKIRNMIPSHNIYIEPFIGGGSVFFSVPYNENIKEVINDKDKDVAKIYLDVKSIGDEIEPFDFISKYTFNKLKNQTKFKSKKERLRRNLILSNLSFRSDRKNYAPSKTIRSGKGRDYSKYKERLKNTKILNQDYKSVIKKYDSPTSFFYLDPPYSTAIENKDYNDNDVSIEEIINILKNIKGKFILSYDNNAKAKQLSRDAGFKILNVKTKYTDGKGGHTIDKKELIIRNY